jgi:hypothetical protein
LLSHWLEQVKSSASVEIPATVATWAIYGLASHWSHAKGKRPSLDQFVEEALPFVAVNLESFAKASLGIFSIRSGCADVCLVHLTGWVSVIIHHRFGL